MKTLVSLNYGRYMNIYRERLYNYLRLNKVVMLLLLISSVFGVIVFCFFFGNSSPRLNDKIEDNLVSRFCLINFMSPIDAASISDINNILENDKISDIVFEASSESIKNGDDRIITPTSIVLVSYKNNILKNPYGNVIKIDNNGNEVYLEKGAIDPFLDNLKIDDSISINNVKLRLKDTIANNGIIVSFKSAKEMNLKFSRLRFSVNEEMSEAEVKSNINKIREIAPIINATTPPAIESEIELAVAAEILFMSSIIVLITTVSYIFMIFYLIDLQDKDDQILHLFGVSQRKINRYKIFDVILFNTITSVVGISLFALLYKPILENYSFRKNLSYDIRTYIEVFLIVVLFSSVFSVIFIKLKNIKNIRSIRNIGGKLNNDIKRNNKEK